MTQIVNIPARAADQPRRTPGVLLAGGLARRMGGGDKPMRPDRRPHHPGARDRAAEAAMRRAYSQRQWRSGTVRRLRPARHRRHGGEPSRTAGGHSRCPRLGRGPPARGILGFERGGGLSFPATRSGRATASRARRTGRRACGRRLRRTIASGDRAVARRPCARSCATLWWWKISERSAAGPRATGSPP